MVRQKALSLKLDFETLEQLEREVSCGWMKRNRHINEALRFYLDYKDTTRRIRAYPDRQDKIDEYSRFKAKWFPCMDGI